MVLFLPGRKEQQSTTAQRFSDAFGAGLEALSTNMQQRQQEKLAEEQMTAENQAAQEMGINLSGIRDPKMRQQILTSALQGKRDESQSQSDLGRQLQLQQSKFEQDKQLKAMDLEGRTFKEERTIAEKEAKAQQEQNEKIAPFQAGIETVQQMRQLRAKGNLGRGSSILGFFGGETARDRGQYEQLGKSLISLASNIPIRNQMEFQTLAEKLYDPSLTDGEAEGVLNAMEKILNQNMKKFQVNEAKGSQESEKKIPLGDIWK
jgi:hypothetical protein